jgi:chorismate dehydratase
MKAIGISTYLNTQPILYPFQQKIIEAPFRIIEMLPHDCAKLLKEQKFSAALIPSIEYARGQDDYFILDSFSISSKNIVKSVELFFNKDLKDIKKVALDSSSRTSVILTKIILEEKFGIYPEYIEMTPNLDEMLKKADAALIIADNALKLYDKVPQKFDLAEEWRDMTGLPFVFAFVAGRGDGLEKKDIIAFDEAIKYGTTHLDEISQNWAQKNTEFDASFYKNYLEENISFDFGEEERESLNIFFDYAFLRNDIDYFPDIKYFERG